MHTRLIYLLRAIMVTMFALSLAACGLMESSSTVNNSPTEQAEEPSIGTEIPERPDNSGTPAPLKPTTADGASTAELAPCPVPATTGGAVTGGTSLEITPEATLAAVTTPEAAQNDCKQLYNQLLAEYGADFSQCEIGTAVAGTCQKPESLDGDLKENINIQLILDSSGSMAGALGGQTKLQIAQQVLTRFVGTLPESANVALRVYGHVGSNNEADRALSCRSTELFYDFQLLDVGLFTTAIESFQPTGWTPVAGALEAARADFEPFDPASSTNIIYLVSDGIETCGGDPVAAARTLAADNIGAVVNVIGFDVDAAATEQLRATAEAGLGEYFEARSAQELDEVFAQRIDWEAWSAYYDCLRSAAGEQLGATQENQGAYFKCITELNERSFMTIRDEVTRRFEAKETSRECYLYVATESRNLYLSIQTAARGQYIPAMSAARDEYQNALEAAREEFQDATNPSP